MVSSKRFKPVQRIAESREKTAAKDMGDSQRRMHSQEARLEELKRYHQEYLGRFESSARSGMSSSQLQEYRAFLSKLDRAIKEQERIVQASHQECAVRKDVWKQKHVRTQALGKAVERFKKAELKTSDAREQKELDDRNQRKK